MCPCLHMISELVKAEWDVVKRAKGYTSNNEMVKHMLRGLKRAKNAPPKCSETNSVLCVDSSVKAYWDAVKRAHGYKTNTQMVKDLLRKDKKRGNDFSSRCSVTQSYSHRCVCQTTVGSVLVVVCHDTRNPLTWVALCECNVSVDRSTIDEGNKEGGLATL